MRTEWTPRKISKPRIKEAHGAISATLKCGNLTCDLRLYKAHLAIIPKENAMSSRRLQQIIPSVATSDGAGVSLRRSLGSSPGPASIPS
jgi:hypothetical protein